MNLRVPAGYTRVDEADAIVVARDDVVEAIVGALKSAPSDRRTLHGLASRLPDAGRLEGRETAYAIALPGSSRRVVVRHNRHGGLLRGVTGDLFAGGTRAPSELEIALRLQRLGVSTPAVLAYAVYPSGVPGLSRSDVVTEEIGSSTDLGAALLDSQPESPERLMIWGAVTRLLHRLANARVRHHDLNVKNILIRTLDDGRAAYLLDVDRIEFDCTRRDAFAGNRARLRRSVEKWQRLRGLRLVAGEPAVLRSGYLTVDASTTSS